MGSFSVRLAEGLDQLLFLPSSDELSWHITFCLEESYFVNSGIKIKSRLHVEPRQNVH